MFRATSNYNFLFVCVVFNGFQQFQTRAEDVLCFGIAPALKALGSIPSTTELGEAVHASDSST